MLPQVGQGASTIGISLQHNLLKKADALAKKKGLNRSELIAQFVLAGLERRAV
jgi:metal-responsive CopG/Arc/MetJ family transcriptional regulator